MVRRGGGRPPAARTPVVSAPVLRAGEWKRTGTARQPAPVRRPEPAPRAHRDDVDEIRAPRGGRARPDERGERPRSPAPAERGWKPAPSRTRVRAPERETLPPSRREPAAHDRDERRDAHDRPLPASRRAPVRGPAPVRHPAHEEEFDREPAARSRDPEWRPAPGRARAAARAPAERDRSLVNDRVRDRDRAISRGRDRGMHDEFSEREPAPRAARSEPRHEPAREAPRAQRPPARPEPREAPRPAPRRAARPERPYAEARPVERPGRQARPAPVPRVAAPEAETSSWLVSPPSLIPGEFPAPSFSVAPLVPSAPVARAPSAPPLPPAPAVDVQAQLQAKLAPLMQILGHQFRDITILHHALTHSSSKGQAGASQYDNERMEFLGDSVLGLAMAEWLYEKYPEGDEGLMSKLKSHLVSTKNMAIISAENRIPDYMILGGSGVDAARRNERLICSALEAVTGAVFLDAGFNAARGMLRRIFYDQMRNLDARETMEEDAKSTLQEYLQTNYHVLPRHESFLHDDAGDKIYITVIKAKSIVLGEGMGKSKKDSQQAAAKRSLERLRSGLVKIK